MNPSPKIKEITVKLLELIPQEKWFIAVQLIIDLIDEIINEISRQLGIVKKGDKYD